MRKCLTCVRYNELITNGTFQEREALKMEINKILGEENQIMCTKKMEEYEALEMYDAMLDNCYPEVEVCGYTYQASHTLKEVDPIAYREDFNYWLDSENIEVI